MCIHSTIISAGSLFMQFGLNRYGVESIAGFTIASRINSITFLPLLSMGTAIAAFTGQNYGAKRFMRIRIGIRNCFSFSVICSIITTILFLLFGRELVRLFTGTVNEALEKDALTYLYIGIPFYLILGVLIVYRGALQAMGNTTGPIASSFFELAVRISGVLILPIFYGYFGICLTNPLAWVGGVIPVLFIYWRVMRNIPKRNLGFGGTKKWIGL